MARAVLAEAEEPRTKLQALNALQNVYWRSGRYAEAERFNGWALRVAEEVGDPKEADDLYFLKAQILHSTGRYAESVRLLEEILPRRQRRPANAETIQVQAALGHSYNLLGHHAEAEPLLRQAFELSQDSVGPAIRILTVSNLLYCLVCQGTAEGFLGEAEAALELGEYTITANLRLNLALAYSRLGRWDEAARHYRMLAEGAFDPNYSCIAWAKLASIGAERPEAAIDKAMELYLQAETPAARFIVLQSALSHGSPAQKSWALGELKRFDPAPLPWLFRGEYDELRARFLGSS